MATVRILVDGNGLLHTWPDLAPGKPWNSSAACAELAHRLTLYFDATGTPLTLVFDALQEPLAREIPSSPEMEIIFCAPGSKPTQTLERLANRLLAGGEILVVTDHPQISEMITARGGALSGCAPFVQTVERTLAEMEREIEQLNQRERLRFNNAA